jgi:2'-5' RNA ligase
MLNSISDLAPAATNHKYTHGCLMLQVPDYELKGLTYLRTLINPNDLYESHIPGEFGLENDPHVTILFGFHDDNRSDFAKRVLFTPPFTPVEHGIPLFFSGLSVFSAKDYDVLKFDVVSLQLESLNRLYKQHFAHTETHPNYHPHLTVGYLQKGVATPTFLNQLWEAFKAEPGQDGVLIGNELKYSSPNGDQAFKTLL